MRVHGGTGLVWLRGTAVGKARFQLKGSMSIRGKGQSEGVDLCLDLLHGPGCGASLQDAHVACEIFSGV
jgi:hypothetical protein